MMGKKTTKNQIEAMFSPRESREVCKLERSVHTEDCACGSQGCPCRRDFE